MLLFSESIMVPMGWGTESARHTNMLGKPRGFSVVARGGELAAICCCCLFVESLQCRPQEETPPPALPPALPARKCLLPSPPPPAPRTVLPLWSCDALGGWGIRILHRELEDGQTHKEAAPALLPVPLA